MSKDNRPRSLFSTRLRLLRKNSNMTQKQVATKLSIDRSTYAYYEIDKTKPDYDTLLHISRIFDVSVDYLLGRDREPLGTVTLHDNRLFPQEPSTDEPIESSELTEDERAFINLYRQLDAVQKNEIMQFALEHRFPKHTLKLNK